MPLDSLSTQNGNVVFRISGTFTPEELADSQGVMTEAIRRHGRIRVLIVAVGFQGWARSLEWGRDPTFQEQHDGHIDRMALVGERKWEELALLFTSKGARPFPIEFFGPDELARARAWVENGPA